jgi:GxxExxY protein
MGGRETHPTNPFILRILVQTVVQALTLSVMQHETLTHKIIGCAMTVHNVLGCGFQELIYQRALAIEMSKQGLLFQREQEMPIFYDGRAIGTRRVDFFVENTIMVEFKALTKLEDVHVAQSINYCEAYNLPIGLLVNFGTKRLEFRRLYNLKHPDNQGYSRDKKFGE